MSKELPFVSCLCPTYGRPELLRNAIQCFLNQTYPANRRELIIWDDLGQYQSMVYMTVKGTFEMISTQETFESLPDKYNALAQRAQGDVIAVWEDDDIYLPYHLSSQIRELTDASKRVLMKTPEVISHYNGKIFKEASDGRFHGSLVFTRALLDYVKGWPATKRADFDQTVIKLLESNAEQILKNIYTYEGETYPSYVFRWESTKQPHGQHYMENAADENWYGKYHANVTPEKPRSAFIIPKFDADTERFMYDIRYNLQHKLSIENPTPRDEYSGMLLDRDFQIPVPQSLVHPVVNP